MTDQPAPSEKAEAAARGQAAARNMNRSSESHDQHSSVSTPKKTQPSDGADGSDSKKQTESQADLLVRLATSKSVELFHNAERKPFATVRVDNHMETHPIYGRDFRFWLQGHYWTQHRKAPGSQAITDALGTIAGKAMFEGKEHRTFTRLAELDRAYWLDLGDEDWHAIKIAAAGWTIEHTLPVKFIRSKGLQPLPAPASQGIVNELRRFLNVSSFSDWVLILAWLVAAMRPVGPYPILVIYGEQGTAKSTLCRILRRIIDPNVAPIRSAPREVRDLMIAATNCWVVAFDNMSRIPSWLSDALCRLSTGGGFSTRELYSDREEIIFDAMRPVILNGITEMVTRSDLLDRSICITLTPIPEDQRKPESQLYSEFELVLPEILGGLLDVISHAMAKFPNVKLEKLPRMADFATWAVAAEEALGLPAGSFMQTYMSNQDDANQLAIEVSAIGPAIQGLMKVNDKWTGTAKELLANLENNHSDNKTRMREDWPKNPAIFSKLLHRIAPNLRRSQIEVTFAREGGRDRKRLIHLENSCNLPSEPSDLSENPERTGQKPSKPDGSDTSDSKIQQLSNPIGTIEVPDELRDEFEERAGILQFDGGLPRDLAEKQALFSIRKGKPP